MATPKDRKLIQITSEAYQHLLRVRDARTKELKFRLVSLTDCASELIMNTPINDGHDPCEDDKEDK